MKYFEFHEPYYGLIPAESKVDAVKNYEAYVSDEPDLQYMKEISREQAIKQFGDVLRNRIEDLGNSAIEAEFNERKDVLLIDGSFA